MLNSEHKITVLQRALLDLYPPTRVFAIISWGAAATSWLATVLNNCPDIFCTHALNQIWRNFVGANPVDGLAYLQMIGMQGHAARAAGDVHGVDRGDVPALREFFGDKFRAAVVIRDPRSRLSSQLALFDYWADAFTYEIEYLDTMYPDALKMLPTGNYDERLFVHGINMINAILEEIAVGPVFRMEDLTRDPATLVRLVEHISAGDVVPLSTWAEAQVKTKPTNPHRREMQLVFLPWQQSVARAVIKPEAIRLYREFGYDMSWVGA